MAWRELARDMAATLKLTPGSIVRKGSRRLIILDWDGFDTVITSPVGGTGEIRVRIKDLTLDQPQGKQIAAAHDLTEISEKDWNKAVQRFEVLKTLLEKTGRLPRVDVEAAANLLDCGVSTLYQWMQAYSKSGRISSFIRKARSDKGDTRLSAAVEAVIAEAIETKFLTAEKPDVATVIEEVNLLCDERKLKRPHANSVRNRVLVVPDRLKMARRRGKKIAAQHYEPLRGSFPGAEHPLAVVQIDHTPMDVIVVDEQYRKPIDRPYLTIVIDVFSRMVVGFAIYLEKPSALATGLAIAHAVLPKDDWLGEMGLKLDWPCWGKMRKIHTDNAKEFRGTVLGRACEEHDIVLEHRPKGQPHYGGHVERGFRTFMRQSHTLKGTTFSNVAEKAEYDSEGHAVMTRKELERWFTIYIAKYYPNKFHRGIKTTPLARYQEGIHGSDEQLGIGLPPRVADPRAFMLDFLPFEHRTVQEYGIVLDWVFYYDDALRQWINSKDPETRKARQFLIRFNPRDMREIYFLDPAGNTYITIPYRDRSHPPVSRWELQAAEKRLREKGYRNVNEALLFEALREMRDIEEEAERNTKKARRAKEKRDHQPALPARRNPLIPKPQPAPKKTAPIEEDDDFVPVFGIVEEPK